MKENDGHFFRIEIPVGEAFIVHNRETRFRCNEYDPDSQPHYTFDSHCEKCWFWQNIKGSDQFKENLDREIRVRWPYLKVRVLPCEVLSCGHHGRTDRKDVYFTLEPLEEEH